MRSLIRTTFHGLFLVVLTGVLTTLPPSAAARAQTLVCNITDAIPNPDASGDAACDAGLCVYAGGTVAFTGQASDGVAPYDVLWELPGGEPPEFGANIAASGGTSSITSAYNAPGSFNATFSIKDSAKGNKTQTCSATLGVQVIPVSTGEISINSTSQNTANAPTTSVPEQPAVGLPEFNLVVANDLGMHCADIDYQVFSILPPFNVFHAQVIKKGTAAGVAPNILNNTDVELVYSASSNALDPALQNRTTPSIFKSNFWERNPVTLLPYGFEAYDPLYPTGVLSPDAFVPDLGIPVPDVYELYLGGGTLVAGQQAMPGISNPYTANHPQHFDRYDPDFPFFINFPFGYTAPGVNWFAADGIPALPVDDQGRSNAYPLFRVQAIDKTGNLTGIPGTILASTDAVAPVASEADCQNCHVDPFDCTDPSLPPEIISTTCNGSAVAPTEFTNTNFIVENLATAPGNTSEQQLLNAAKINILRLHDAKHGTAYTSSIDQSATPCDATADPNDADCLDNRRPVQCSWCHYSPALDLAQVGPIDEPSHGVNGRQQTRHISMSRAMHGFHGQFTTLFPDLAPPDDPRRVDPATGELVINDYVQTNLEQNCYQCHPGKRTQCLRGAMFAGGMVCQDCHGNMAQVGDDFSENLPITPFPAGADLSKRVPWATEPGCQSCHTGDAVDNLSGDHEHHRGTGHHPLCYRPIAATTPRRRR